MVVFDFPPIEVSADTIMNATPASYSKIIKTQNNKLPDCMVRASDKYGVSLYLLEAIRAQEAGTIGMVNFHETYGTTDYGVFQINKETWMEEIHKQHNDITWVEVAYDACVNTFAASAILASEIRKADGDVWVGVGNYNHNKKSSLVKHYKYSTNVMKHYLVILNKEINKL